MCDILSYLSHKIRVQLFAAVINLRNANIYQLGRTRTQLAAVCIRIFKVITLGEITKESSIFCLYIFCLYIFCFLLKLIIFIDAIDLFKT